MNVIHAEAYRTAFVAYLRKGTPIRLSIKNPDATSNYVWRTAEVFKDEAISDFVDDGAP